MKTIEQKTTTLKKTVIAACVLHNICIERGDLYEANDSNPDNSSDDDSEGRNETGNNIRDILKDCVGKPLKNKSSAISHAVQSKRVNDKVNFKHEPFL